MNFKRYNESDNSWTDSHYIKKTDTDTITTLPATIYPLAQTATIGLKGNTTQNGTPTPDNPVMPQGTGDKTAQLYFKKIVSGSIGADGGIVANASFDCYVAKVEANKQYIGTGYVYAFYTSEPALGSVSYNGQRVAASAANGFTSPIDGYVAVRHNAGVTDAMLNTGSTALPYEPYGVKIPISSANITTPVYLGEVESTRRIKKLVLTGEESGWQLYQQPSPAWRYEVYQFWLDNIIDSIQYSSLYSTIAPFGVTSQNRQDYEYGCYAVSSGKSIAFQMVGAKDTFTNVTAWKTYLQQQYAAGTPVTVWYVLATEETGIVNEPLQKIGSYADSISGISIPTTAGANTLDVQTTLKPSEVTASYSGWHPVSSVHERSGGAWT